MTDLCHLPDEQHDAALLAQLARLQEAQAELQAQDCTDPARARLSSTLQAAINALTHYRQSGQSLLRALARVDTARAEFQDTQGEL